MNRHMGAMTAAMHTAALSVMVAAAMLGLQVSLHRLARFAVVSVVLVAVFLGGTRALYTWLLLGAIGNGNAVGLRAPAAVGGGN